MTDGATGGPVVVAPDAMRGHLNARGVAAGLARGVAGAAPGVAVREVPLADGGDGTLDVVARAAGGIRRSLEVPDALGRPRPSAWLDLRTSALVESARCCGLAPLAATELDPMRATSAGVGVAIAAAVRAGHRWFTSALAVPRSSTAHGHPPQVSDPSRPGRLAATPPSSLRSWACRR